MSSLARACASRAGLSLSVIFVVLQSGPARALDLDPAANAALETVVVTATRSPVSLTEVPASVTVVTAEQILDTPAQGLDDILQNVPGMDLTAMGPDVGHPTAYNESMRGLPTTATRMLVLLDGIPINDPFFGYIQWNRIPLDDIDRVEVVRGGGAALWGDAAMGGVVNVITQTPEKQGIRFDGSGGSYGTYRNSVDGAYFPTGGLKLSLNAAVSGTNGYQTTPPSWYTYGTTTLRSPVYTPTTFNAQNVDLRSDFAPGGGLTGFADIHYYDDKQVLSTPIGVNEQRIWTYAAEFEYAAQDGASLSGTVFHSDSDFVTDNPHLLTFATEYDSNVHTTPVSDTGTSLVWSRALSGVVRNYTVGADFHSIDGVDRTDYLTPSGALQVPTVLGGGDQIFAGAFAQARLVPIGPLQIQASAREQYYENLHGIDTFPPAIGSIPASHRYSFDPRVDVRYSLAGPWALRGAYYRSFRAPTLDELYRTYADTTSGIYEGNPFLEPETLEGGEVGLDFVRQGVRSQLTFYSTHLSNVITQENLNAAESPPGLSVTCGYDPATYTYLTCTRNINAASALARGIEEELTWTIGRSVSVELGYTYADSRYTSNPVDPVTVGQRLEGVPRNDASAGLTYAAPAGWKVSTQLRWVSTSYGDADPADNLVQEAHFVVDVSADYPLGKRLQLYTQIQNLLNRHYIADSSGGPPILGTPFEIVAGVRARLD